MPIWQAPSQSTEFELSATQDELTLCFCWYPVNVLSTFVAVLFVDWFGRKALLTAGGIQMIAAEVVVGVTLAVEFANYGVVLPNNVSIGVLVVICVFICGFAYSWGPIGTATHNPGHYLPYKYICTGMRLR